MRQTVKELQGERILAKDGFIGSVEDVYFDDERWGVRYLVVDTGEWLPGRRVLVSPASVEAESSTDDAVHVRLTLEQVKGAPDVDSDRPVSRQQEIANAKHFGYPHYWSGPLLWGVAAYPAGGNPINAAGARPGLSAGEVGAEAEHAARAQLEQADSHLRSGAAVIGYGIEARDGAIGEVEDFVINERSWAITGVVVDTTKWWPAGQVRVSPDEVERIDRGACTMHLKLTRDELKRAAAR